MRRLLTLVLIILAVASAIAEAQLTVPAPKATFVWDKTAEWDTVYGPEFPTLKGLPYVKEYRLEFDLPGQPGHVVTFSRGVVTATATTLETTQAVPAGVSGATVKLRAVSQEGVMSAASNIIPSPAGTGPAPAAPPNLRQKSAGLSSSRSTGAR